MTIWWVTFHPLPRSEPCLIATIFIEKEGNRLGQTLYVCGIFDDLSSHIRDHDIGGSIESCRDDWQSACQRLEDRQRAGIIESRVDVDVTGRVILLHVRYRSQKDHVISDTQFCCNFRVPADLSPPCNEQTQRLLGKPLTQKGEGIYQRFQALEAIVVSRK